MLARPLAAYISSKTGDNSASARSTIAFDLPQRMILGYKLLGREDREHRPASRGVYLFTEAGEHRWA